MDYLLAGRKLTLPAFVATLVTTWYGGILGVGEYAWRFGISTWVVFGLPYYAAALLFAFWLAPRLRRSGAASIPDLLLGAYGRGARLTGAAAIFGLTLPVAYLLMLATLLTQLTGWPPLVAVAVGAAFSAALCRDLGLPIGGPDRHPPVRTHVRGVLHPAPRRAGPHRRSCRSLVDAPGGAPELGRRSRLADGPGLVSHRAPDHGRAQLLSTGLRRPDPRRRPFRRRGFGGVVGALRFLLHQLWSCGPSAAAPSRRPPHRVPRARRRWCCRPGSLPFSPWRSSPP